MADLVGGSFLSAALQVLFDRIASGPVLEFFKCRKLDDVLLKELKVTMRSVNKLLNDAEEKQITDSAVKDWLDELKDAVYDAEDLLEEIAYDSQRLGLENGSQSSIDKVRNLFSSINPFNKEKEEMVKRLEESIKRIVSLRRQNDELGLKEREKIGETPSSQKIPTSSVLDDSGVYGRHEDKAGIIDFLLSDDSNGNRLGVISIVGMGGIGKTTLARLAYNDSRVQNWFDLKVWAYVSEEFNVLKLTKELLKEIGSTSCDNMPMDRLQRELLEKLKDKKFLLVVDDVWHDQIQQWDSLLIPLKHVAQGSKIVMTTRNERVALVMEKVASVMLTSSTYHLKELNDDSCWLLFAKRAFKNEDSSPYPTLEGIGRKIAKMCKGIPLAAKTLGSLLCTDRDAKEWEKILKSKMWDLQDDGILPALRLSYCYLPSHLKRCFAYCAVFPKGYRFKRHELTLLWKAEGFIVHHKGIEQTGDRYFDDLVSRSFFQRSSDNSCFTMHDLMNDLAQFVSGEFCFKLEDDPKYQREESGLECDRCYKVLKRTRHLSYPRSRSGDVSKMFEGIHVIQPLRTFLPLSVTWPEAHFDDRVLHHLLTILKRLRVLSLSRYHINQVPDSIGNLIHLRYLNLSETPIERLPEILSTLYNLQTLILHRCNHLIELPANMSKLVNLELLDVSETNLKEMPSRMGRLTRLQKLTDFFLGKQTGSSIHELGNLMHLQDLCIQHLQNVREFQDALEANLKGKKQLKRLILRWNGDTDDSYRERMLLEYLKPHTGVEDLRIFGYGGTSFPDWVGDSSFSNIVELELNGCKYCTSLPPLGQLATLVKVWIRGFDGVQVVGSEFCGSYRSAKPFASLKSLTFERMIQWQEWIPCENDAEGGAFPLLQELCIEKCPNLTTALPRLPSLSELKIKGCPMLTTLHWPADPCDMHTPIVERNSLFKATEQQISRLSTFLAEIDIRMEECDGQFFQLELFPRLRSLGVNDCLNLESLCAEQQPLGDLTFLSFLSIRNCPRLVTFPRGGLPASNLTNLHLRACASLKSLPERMHSLLPSLEYLFMGDCPEIERFPEGGLPSKLQSLNIENCKKLVAGRMEWDLRSLPALSRFSIRASDNVDSFPEESLLPSTLTSLVINRLENLTSLDYKGLQHLNSLTELTICNCPNLKSMPEEGLPYSLLSLLIIGCPSLQKRCEREIGEDWHKISHIPAIEVADSPWTIDGSHCTIM